MKNPQKYEKFMLLVIGVVLSLLLALGLIQYFSPHTGTIEKNYIGQKGAQGNSIQGSQGLIGPQGIQGLHGVKGDTGATGTQGVAGFQGPAGAASTVPGPVGPVGDNGQDGRQIEQRCSSKGDYQWRYVGDESWQTMKKNSQACQSAT